MAFTTDFSNLASVAGAGVVLVNSDEGERTTQTLTLTFDASPTIVIEANPDGQTAYSMIKQLENAINASDSHQANLIYDQFSAKPSYGYNMAITPKSASASAITDLSFA